MGILAFILFGLIAGAVAQFLLPGNDPGDRGLVGLAITVGIGIIGAFVGGFLASLMGLGAVTGFNVASFAIAIGGAIVFLIIWGLITGSGTRRAV